MTDRSRQRAALAPTRGRTPFCRCGHRAGTHARKFGRRTRLAPDQVFLWCQSDFCECLAFVPGSPAVNPRISRGAWDIRTLAERLVLVRLTPIGA